MVQILFCFFIFQPSSFISILFSASKCRISGRENTVSHGGTHHLKLETALTILRKVSISLFYCRRIYLAIYDCHHKGVVEMKLSSEAQDLYETKYKAVLNQLNGHWEKCETYDASVCGFVLPPCYRRSTSILSKY